MRIAFLYPSGPRSASTAMVLGDDAVKDCIMGYRPKLTFETQIAAPPRATEKQGFARGLCEIRFPFRVERSLGDYATAVQFIHDHFAVLELHQAGVLSFSQDGATGTKVAYRSAILQSVEVVEHYGAFVAIEYQWWCSKLTTS